jgi:hypothetical protein
MAERRQGVQQPKKACACHISQQPVYLQRTNYLKAFFTITLLLALGFSQVGYYFVMLIGQHQLKEDIEAAIHNNLTEKEMETISYTDNYKNIFWEEEGKEFLFKGEMYDVVKSAVVKGKKLLYCINDKKEKELIEKYSALTKNNSGNNKKQKSNTYQFETLFVYESKEVNTHIYVPITNGTNFYTSNLAKGISKITFPPPKA